MVSLNQKKQVLEYCNFPRKMFRYIFMTLGYQVPLPFEEDLCKKISREILQFFAEYIFIQFAKGDVLRSNKISLYSWYFQNPCMLIAKIFGLLKSFFQRKSFIKRKNEIIT